METSVHKKIFFGQFPALQCIKRQVYSALDEAKKAAADTKIIEKMLAVDK